MKDIINYYYNFDINEIKDYKNYSNFNFKGEEFYFVFFNRTEEELNDLIKIVYELKEKGIRVHDIILNREKKVLTKVGDVYYLLLKLNIQKDTIIDLFEIMEFNNKLVLNKKNSNLYRNNWAKLWSEKIDYFEYQIKEIGKDKEIILESFSYYVGLAENAISYVNKINNVINISTNDKITLSHRRIFNPNIALNYYNPLSFIFDIEVRDIAEYLKISFFYSDIDPIIDLKTYLNLKKLSSYSYHMLYARLLYPSYYFDIYEDIMNNNSDNTKKLINIIKKVHLYEQFLKNAYIEISKYTNLEHINWILT